MLKYLLIRGILNSQQKPLSNHQICQNWRNFSKITQKNGPYAPIFQRLPLILKCWLFSPNYLASASISGEFLPSSARKIGALKQKIPPFQWKFPAHRYFSAVARLGVSTKRFIFSPSALTIFFRVFPCVQGRPVASQMQSTAFCQNTYQRSSTTRQK